jgi:hypothetical protein
MGKVSPYIQAGSLTAPHLAVGQLVYLASARGISLQPSAVKDWVEFDRFGAMHMSTTGVIYSCYLYKGATTDKPLSPEDQQRQDIRWYLTCFGVVLCISMFFYLTHLAKRALTRAQVEHEAREIRCPGQGCVFLRDEKA